MLPAVTETETSPWPLKQLGELSPQPSSVVGGQDVPSQTMMVVSTFSTVPPPGARVEAAHVENVARPVADGVYAIQQSN